MFDRFLQVLMQQKMFVLLAAAVVLAGGYLAWRRIPVDAFPDVTNVQVMILAEAPGYTPDEVERLITYPIEIEMGGLPGVRQVRSLSKSGFSQVIIVFEDSVDVYFARQLVFERLSLAREDLPEGIEPELGPISTGLGEIFQYSVDAGWYCAAHPREWAAAPGQCAQCGTALAMAVETPTDLRTLQDWTIAPQFRRLPGINEVNSFGGFVKQYHIEPDPSLLLKYRLTLRDIIDAVEANNNNAGGGFIVKDWEQINVVSRGLLRDTHDIERIVLKAEDGTPVYLRDVATVRPGAQTRNGVVTKDGAGEAVIGMTIMLKDANSKTVVDRVKRELPEIQKMLPQGVRMNPFYDRTTLIQACIDTITGALGQGIVFVVLALFIVLWDLRAAGIVAVSIPLMLSISFILMDRAHVTANLMSLGGIAIAIGMIVDAAIVVTENVVRHMREKADTALSRTQIAVDALREVARPIVFSILIIIVVFLPLFSLESMEGKMFKPLALAICFTMVGSMLVSLTVVPALGALLVRRAAGHARDNVLVRLTLAAYMPVLNRALRGRWVTVAIAAAAMVGGFALLPRIGTEFLPALDEGAIAINLVRLPTASAEGSAQQATEIEKRLLEACPEITSVISKTGRAEISEDPMGPEQTDVMIMLKPRREWGSGRTKAAIIADVQRELAAFPGVRPSLSQPISLRVNELISGIKSDVAIKIFGDDMQVLRETAERAAPLLAAIPGAGDVKIEQVSGFSEIDVRVNREAAARHMINIADINTIVEAAIGGATAGRVFEGQKRFDILVRYPEEHRKDIAALRRALVPSPAGYNVPLEDLAEIDEIDTPAQISREDSQRRLIVECNIRGRDMGSFVEEAQRALAGIEASMPQGYRMMWGGQFENQARAMARLRLLVPVAIMIIFLMLFASLRSLKSTVLVLVNLPFALIGGIVAIYLMKINLSVSAAIGFIALLGVAVENGLLLVSFLDQLRAGGHGLHTAVVEACQLRVRPLMMTTLTTLLGLLPLLYATGSGSEIQKPLVAVIFGGLVSSLLLTLIILPVIYALAHGYGAQHIPRAGGGATRA